MSPIAAARTGRTAGSPRLLPLALGVPVLLWQLAFFAVPLAVLVAVTFWEVRSFRLEPAFVLKNWQRVLDSGTFYSALAHTAIVAATTTLLALAIAFPVAYTIALRLPERLRHLAIAALVVPVFSSYLLRVYAWQIVLSPGGIVNSVLGGVGLGPFDLLGGPLSLQIGLLTLTLPVSVLILVFALGGLDPSWAEAAANLGGRRSQVVRHVLLPAIRPSLVLAATTAFLLAFGDYVSPVFLSGSKPPTLSILIVDTVKSGSQWPRASVIGVAMLGLLGLMFVAARALTARRAAPGRA